MTSKRSKQGDLRSFFIPKRKKEEDESRDNEPILPRHNVSNLILSTQNSSEPEPVPEASTSTACAEYRFDISYAIGKSLSNEKKYKYLTESLEPPRSYEYPEQTEGGQKRKFRSDWLKEYSWLVYSQEQNGAYCLPCVLFSGPDSGGKHSVALGSLVTRPLCKYKKALEIFKNHSATDYHKMAVLKSTNFKSSYENPEKAVNNLIETEKLKMIKSNRERLIPIVKTIILCGRENIPLRGHRDDGTLSDDIGQGKFRALLKFRIDSGDSSLQKHLETAPKNATYLSKTTQNQLIDCCHSVILKKVLDKVKEAKYYAVLGDETTDASGTEQLSICIRYLDIKESTIHEEFICFLSATDLTGAALSNQIIQELNQVGLQIENLRGQGYDGGANMSGKYSGVQSQIKQLQPLATYMHCAAHKLNLAIVKACSLPSVRNMMGVVSSVTVFVRESSKRLGLIKQAILEKHPEAKRVKLQNLSDTHWLERHDALLQFKELFDSIIQFLEEFDRISPSSKSASLLASIQRFDFVLPLAVTAAVFEITVSLSRQLQAVALDLNLCYEMVDSVIRILERYRETKYEEIFQEACRIVEPLDIPVQAPRTTKRSTHRSNIEAPDAKEYYRLNVFLPFIDFVLGQLRSRFSRAEHSSILDLFTLIPSAIVKIENLNSIEAAARVYSSDLPHPLSLSGEITLWKELWKDREHLPQTAAEAHQEANEFFPNVKILLQILATLPVSTCSVERSFSSLKLIKSYLRTTMTEERLNGLAAMYIHRDISRSLQPVEVIEEYSKRHSRRLTMH
ncbi:unnamed protein product [Chilo suppressalis]|uniref:TTF-type domain-containing protein n=1 Tax=Chilo suppressalis TaxID=168631 RepID=A0ABN8B0Z0_CHISP|nr:unnamed protein product [Chilo suppressalis]